jgi:predicted PurR-regulated permease PerM
MPVSQNGEEGSAANPSGGEEVGRDERRTLTWLALVALGVIAWIVMPVGVGVLIGTLMAFSLQPLYERWKLTLRPALAALATVLVASVVLIGAFFFVGWIFVSKGSTLARSLIAALGPGAGATGALAAIGRITSRVGIGPDQLSARLRALAESAATRAAGVAETILAATASSLLALFFSMLTMHFILRNWHSMAHSAQQTLPLRPAYTRALFEQFRRVGRTTLLGTIVTGLAQGVLATVGYWVTGVPEPLFFGAATAVASLVPAVGTLLIWVPAALVLILTGHTVAGFAELIWGATAIVGICDYVIRPRLVGGGEGEMPTLVTFVALFGGVEVFGLKGLILGPVIMSLGLAVLRLYAKEMRDRRLEGARPTPPA